ncbi:glycosyl transferase [Butyrivibrio proteoclasticus]|uniref:glycosyl transferase n=1 Tax=Butyrivibrio proteoclasticus TaxID=43305 RepID=UPI0004799BE5|nr:glycosyl transferase [Butyrivibrio proteoclasticus]
MIGTELIKGYGLGNQLFFYIVTRCLAEEKGVDFGFVNPEQIGNVFHSQKGMYFMDIDMGTEIPREDMDKYKIFHEQDDRLFMGNSKHDMSYGCYVSGADPKMFEVEDNTIIYGNMQDQSYFEKYRDKIKEWLHVKEEAESYEYTADDLCIINMRGGEYTSCPELYLDRRYWLNAIKNMKKINPNMRFMIITEDEEAAKKVLPEYECHHFDMGKDYVTIKNARYLILSNSSFSLMPVMSSTELKYAIAPKYWARHNISDGFWSSEQNIYTFLTYQDKRGKLFSAEECRAELEEYKKKSRLYARRNIRPGKVRFFFQNIRRKLIYGVFFFKKMVRSFERRTGIIKTFR